ncbi:minor capsid protein [Comamonas sp. B21-038]|uniref:minor capsid protein n=1 Tax=Comamonas sp. B21-038 TaxID=2918299 RepID=UPI001EFC246E|nr:minor capsid protein [Comamonas sp. B21-038]ULR87402.1 minor capsid protein [Comamonas sp. B21-038]
MATVNELIRDEMIRHATALDGYSNNVVARIMAILNRSNARMAAELAEILTGVDGPNLQAERLTSMLASVRSMIAGGNAEMGEKLLNELKVFVDYETAYLNQMLLSFTPASVHIASVSTAAVYSAAMSRPFQGVLLREVWKDLAAQTFKQVRQSIAQGFLEGKTTDQIIRELRGTKAKGYADGLLQKSRRDVEAVVRTALGHVAGNAHDAFYAKNSDVLKGLKWSATLDLRTTPECRIRDGKLYTPETHKPIGHEIPWGAGPGRLHWRCRSASIPVVKSNKELGIDLPDLEMRNKSRASMDGQVPPDTSYGDWLKKQSAARQDEVLGQTRARLMRDGKLDLADMYSHKGVFLTLDELRQRDKRAFELAGL